MIQTALVVDDSNIIRRRISDELSSRGLKVYEADGVASARKILDEITPDFISLDMEMPDGYGLDLCREIKSDERFESSNIVIITSSERPSLREECFQSGAVAFFLKSNIKESLSLFLENLINFMENTVFTGFRACLVEDSALQRKFITGILSRIGIEVESFDKIIDIMNCLDNYTCDPPDIFLVDYFMEEGNNTVDLVSKIKNHPATCNTPVIALTAARQRDIRNKLFYLGVNDFFQKPFDIEEFYLRLRAHLNNKVLIDELEEKSRKLEIQATTDSLSGLYNRRFFYEMIKKEHVRQMRSKSPYSVILMDIDKFKSINDTYGHACGDEVIKLVGGLLNGSLRSSDIAVRYGGEEFIALLPDTGKENAAALAEKLRLKFHDLCPPCADFSVTCSFAVAESSEGKGYEDVVNTADKRLYTAKSTGRDKVVSD